MARIGRSADCGGANEPGPWFCGSEIEDTTADQAIAVLKSHSQDHNVKLRELAERVIYTGEL